MGFTVYYQSTEPVNETTQAAVTKSLDDLCEGRTWLSCEPVGFFGDGSNEFLMGGSKPNFDPHPQDIADAQADGLPDGTLRDVVEILCQLSTKFGIDWQFSHDHDPGPIGFVRGGVADADLENQMAGILSSVHNEFGSATNDASPHGNLAASRRQNESENDSDNDDDGPMILKFGPID